MDNYKKSKTFIKKIIATVVLLTGFSANAANVLVATTAETRPDAIQIIDNTYDLFANITGNVVTDGRGILGAASTVSITPDFSGYDVVVVVAVYYGLESDEEGALIDAINTKSSGVFSIMLDGCCGTGVAGGPTITYNGDTTVRVLNSIMSPTPSPSIALGPHGFFPMTFSLSTASPYAYSFAGLPTLEGGAYKTILNLPSENILYYDSLGQASGIFLPETETNGACVFTLLDASPFSDSFLPANMAFAEVIQDATLDPKGSCYRNRTGLLPTKVQAIPSVSWYSLLLVSILMLSWVIVRKKV